ncbi:DNA-binding transcriptional LysR family regulator [Erwinia toletana]|uniref:DNA-binding transcriptional LysR family regulator n=1 Tax=Winslowiella toletana TaxID=92490 RepID=A0ABS4P2E1_9GAMM|nr:LysR substrate-binding domain-containing protein [Winslowiella toletana]MBP2166815.1 DNA-binding transcriptional LysR family regulator [Winslowiella toletana]
MMKTPTLRNLDLNLLYAFSILMEELNVSRAAERMFIGQPGLSSALRRLREALGDELFIRVGRKLQPTPRALAIAPDIARALATIERTVQPPDAFDPASWQGEFRVGLCDNLEMAFFGVLTARVRELAPHARVVAVAATKRDSVQLLEEGAYDFSVAVHGEPASWHIRQPLFEQHLKCLYDPQRLKLTLPLSIDEYASQPHVIVSSAGNDARDVDIFLQHAGIKREVVASVSRYSAVGPVLQAVPAIATVPETVAHCMAQLYGLSVSSPPLDFPAEPISMLYRKVDDVKGSAAWFRQLFIEVAAEALNVSGCRPDSEFSLSVSR